VITYISPNIEPISGYKQSEVIGHHFVDFIYHDDKQRILNQFQKVMLGHIEPSEYRFIFKSGGIHWARISSRPIYKEGRVIGLRGVFIDITEHKRLEEELSAEKNKIESIINAMEYGLTIQDLGYNIIYQNEVLKNIFGDQLGKKCYLVYEGKDKVCDGCPVEIAYKDGKSHTSERRVLVPSGEVTFWENTANPIRDASGKIISCLEITRNITKRKLTENMLCESEEKYRSLVESTEDFIYLVDRDYKYLFMNKKHLSRLGLLDDEYLGQAYSTFHSPDETKWFIEKANKVFTTGKSIQHEHKSLRDGRYFFLTLSPVKKLDGTIIAVTIVSKDISEIKSMEEKLKALSLTDELTGIYNRRGFFTLVEQLLKMSKRQKKGIFMLYLDLDDLKVINDTFGHQEGDLALIDTATILKENYRESDIIARIGGDEFVVIPVGTAGDSVEIIIARLQKAVEVHNSKGIRRYKLSLSAGIAYYNPEHPCSIDELLIQGDKSMYEQKRHKYKS